MKPALDRGQWIAARRAAVVAEYDADAATYDQYPYPNDVQQEWVRRLLLTCPAGGLVLDAACGTGRYFALVAEAGLRVVGTDQSAGMLGRARARGIALEIQHVGLQELDVVARFDAAMVIDAMENIPPEDWPVVLANLNRAVRPGAHLYLTVEEQDQPDIDAAFAGLVRRGVPAVLDIVDEGFNQDEGWGYRHFLLRSR